MAQLGLRDGAAGGLNGRRGYQPRGRMLGGSSGINAMIYVRGHASDYDDWAAEGATGWAFADVLTDFKRSERNERLNDRFGTDFTQADRLFFDQVAETAAENDTLRTAAQANTLDNFKHVCDRMLEDFFVDRMEGKRGDFRQGHE